MKQELARKIVHAGLALLFAFGATFVRFEFLLLGVFLLFGFFVFLRFARIKTPLHTVASLSYGELFFPLGVGGALLLAWPHIALFQTAMLVLALADPLAALIGKRFGKHTYTVFGELRSLEGSGTCALVLFGIFLLFGGPITVVVYLTLSLTLVEALAIRGSDNLFLPVATVVLCQLFT